MMLTIRSLWWGSLFWLLWVLRLCIHWGQIESCWLQMLIFLKFFLGINDIYMHIYLSVYSITFWSHWSICKYAQLTELQNMKQYKCFEDLRTWKRNHRTSVVAAAQMVSLSPVPTIIDIYIYAFSWRLYQKATYSAFRLYIFCMLSVHRHIALSVHRHIGAHSLWKRVESVTS